MLKTNIIASIIIGALRVAGLKSEFFQAVAHFYVSGLFVSYYWAHKSWMLYLGIALTVLETICFLVSKL
jgi:hypothetical protein